MIDMGFIDRVTGGIDIHDVLNGGVIKGEASQGAVLSRSGSAVQSVGAG